jgi:hypothetical protein
MGSIKELILLVLTALANLFRWKANSSDPQVVAEEEYQKALKQWREDLQGYAEAKNKAHRAWRDVANGTCSGNLDGLYQQYLQACQVYNKHTVPPKREDFGAK